MKRKRNGDIVFSKKPTDPPFWPVDMTLEEMIERLQELQPEAVQALNVIADDCLRRVWPHQVQKGGGR